MGEQEDWADNTLYGSSIGFPLPTLFFFLSLLFTPVPVCRPFFLFFNTTFTPPPLFLGQKRGGAARWW